MVYYAPMPIIAQAAKKLRHDRKRTKQTALAKETLRTVVKAMRKSPSAKALSKAFHELDKAAKRHIIHKNKAARLKSNLAKLVAKK